jgi:hypothetical protein
VLDELFAEAFVNSTHRVLGRKLKPFCLWHRFQLEILESPFLSGDVINIVDLERAVQACCLTYPEVIKAKINMWSFRWRLAGCSFEAEVKKFMNYVEDHFSPPKFLPQLKKRYMPETINHPPPENLIIFSAVAALTGWKDKEIWMLPLGQAYWYAASHWYQAGAELDFLTPEHLVLRERIKQMQEEKEGRNGKPEFNRQQSS